MIVLFTDFGLEGPYIGQVKARILADAPGATILDLFSDAPAHNPKASAYLLAAYMGAFPTGTIFVAVVDPGVGSARAGIALEAGGQWFVGPDNGLFEIAVRRAGSAAVWELDFDPGSVSASFHGRDVFAPAAARLESGSRPPGAVAVAELERQADWPDDLAEIVYIDRFGNAITGMRGCFVKPTFALRVNHVYLEHAGVFFDVSKGTAFWYVNSNGLVEIAVNQGRAADMLGIAVGASVWFGEANGS